MLANSAFPKQIEITVEIPGGQEALTDGTDFKPAHAVNQMKPFPTIQKFLRSKSFRRASLILILIPSSYFLLAAIGLIPVNANFKETEQGVEIFVYSDSVHSEFVFPTKHRLKDWTENFGGDLYKPYHLDLPYVGFGFGDRKFFIETPTWSDFKIATASKAFFLPTEAALKVTYQLTPAPGPNIRKIRISEAEYQSLIDYIENSIAGDQPKPIGNFSHGPNDRFFEANGTYHLFATCNAWVGRGMSQAGIKVGWFTPLPKSTFWYLEKP